MQCLSLYLQLYAKINFNILYTYMLNVFILPLFTLRKIKLNHRITFWGWIAISSGIFPSGTPGITHTTTWLWDASSVPPLGNAPNTSGGANGSPSDHRLPQQERTEYSRTYGGPSQSPRHRTRGKAREYWRPRGYSLTRESPHAKIPQRTSPSFRGWDAPLWRV